MYIAQANRTSPPSELSKKKQCVSVNVKDELSILLNYKEAPPIKFLILQARNLNQMTNHFIRLHFVPSTDNLWKVVVGVAVVVLLLVGVVVSTNRCKNSDFDVEPDMVYYEVDSPNRLSDEEESTRARDASWPETQEERVLVRDSTSLLHSK